MRSSDWERLGDWQRKQRWGFEYALDDKLTRSQRKTQRSSVISTDTSKMDKRERFKIDKIELFKIDWKEDNQFIIDFLFNVRGYSEEVESDNENFVYFSNGKSTIRINTNYRSMCPGYKFDEFFENEDIMSKGCFPSTNSGVYTFEDIRYFMRDDYKGSEYFRQAFLYNDKLATIALILKKTAEHPGWCCTFPEFTMYIELSYFDINENKSLKGFNTNATLEWISLTDSFLIRDAIPDYSEIIPVADKTCGRSGDSDSSYFSRYGKNHQCYIEKGLSKALKKVERYLGTSLEKKEKLGFVKRLIPTKNKGNK